VKTTPLTGRQATKDEVLNRIDSVALVHIAACTEMDSGKIALSPNTTRTSKIPKEEDYILSAKNLADVKMRARLVVLSCCHSGQEKSKCEEVVGIAQAFLAAGARSVLVSPRRNDDEATIELLRSFYQHLASGTSTSVALQEATNVSDIRRGLVP